MKFTILSLLTALTLTFYGCSGNKSRTLPDQSDEDIFDIVYQPGAKGDYQRVIFASDSLLSLNSLSDSLRAYVMMERMVALINSGQGHKASAVADSLVKFGEATSMDEAVMQGLQCMGLVCKQKEDYDSAIHYYRRALDLSIATHDTEQEQAVAELLAVAYSESDRNTESIDLSRRALGLARELNDTIAMLNSVSTLAAALGKTGDMSGVIAELQPYTPLLSAAAPTHNIKFHTPLFHAYLYLDSIDKARSIMHIMELNADKLPEGHMQRAITVYAKSKLEKRLGNHAEELALLQRMKSMPAFGQKQEALNSTEGRCLANMGRYAEAYDAMERAFVALDSTRNSSLERELSQLSAQYDTLTKEIEIERLARQRWIIASIALLCFIALAVLWLIRRAAYRRRLEHERRLQYVKGLEQERSRVARELHDDIAGSLIGLQWEIPQLDHGQTMTRIRDIGRRVRMLSHQMMPPQFTRQSLIQLLTDFTAVFNRTHTGVAMMITDEGTFDWDSLSHEQAHELYRIVQENVNNILKHSDATEINIRLDGSTRFKLTIINNGAYGMDSNVPSGIGGSTLSTRAELLGATLSATVANGIFTLTIAQK